VTLGLQLRRTVAPVVPRVALVLVFVVDDRFAVPPARALILDSGSTITEVAKNFGEKKNLRIITNAINIALLLGTGMSFEIMVTGRVSATRLVRS
jgi:hypothetical protein